jgi:hypothetical protein
VVNREMRAKKSKLKLDVLEAQNLYLYIIRCRRAVFRMVLSSPNRPKISPGRFVLWRSWATFVALKHPAFTFFQHVLQ